MTNETFRDEFAKFFQEPTLVTLREVLSKTTGELPHLDFKLKWQDYPKLARHLLAMGNSGGGCIIVGVSEMPDGTLDPVGLGTIEDNKILIDKIKNFIPKQIMHKITTRDFSYQEAEYTKIIGKKFQAIFIRVDPEDLPLISTNEHTDKIRNNTIYVRRGTSSEIANYEEVQIIINKRIRTEYSSQPVINLRTHLDQLRALMDELAKCNYYEAVGFNIFGDQVEATHKSFIESMIAKKRSQIEKLTNA